MKKNMVVFWGAFFLFMTISSHSSALFTMPYDADLFFSPVGGEANHATEC